MSAIVERYGLDSQVRPDQAAGWSVSAPAFEACESEWRQLESGGLATPYQRFDWLSAFSAHVMPQGRAGLKVARIADRTGRAMAFLPLAVTSRGGLRTASIPGGKHANFHMPVMHRAFAETAGDADALECLRQASAALGIDAFLFGCQPVRWNGAPNPFARVAPQPSPSPAYRLPLLGTCEATLLASMSSTARRKHKQKRVRLDELGPNRVIRAETAEERRRILTSFFRQKALRFAEMGVPDPFADPGVDAFLEAAAADGRPQPALSLYGLELNGALIATYVGAVHGERFSGMATSFELDPAVMKISPGEILLLEVIRHECQAGRTMLDLGVGEARYKATICNEFEELVDNFVGVTWRGKAAAGVARRLGAAKGYVKRTPALYELLLKLRGPHAAKG